MKYCKNCKKIIEPKEDNYNGLCLNCYKEYLFEKIEHIGDNQYNFKSNQKKKPKNFINFLKKFFTKK
jgi:DNA-directed RNA polymerase subunit M/transcription elongation factor TFIIS